jgi:hypothetical protein
MRMAGIFFANGESEDTRMKAERWIFGQDSDAAWGDKAGEEGDHGIPAGRIPWGSV